ncbi:MAG: hypothetical protein ACREBW_01300 [Candidatus Micrarchaeaceae archaeon]
MTQTDRWISRGLVTMLVNEMRNYQAAAEIVSGSEDVFAMCGRDIQAKIEAVEKEHSAVSVFELQKVLEAARHEIAGHEAWQREVIESLAKEDDEDGATGPLRQAFAKSVPVREALLERVKEAFENYFQGS